MGDSEVCMSGNNRRRRRPSLLIIIQTTDAVKSLLEGVWSAKILSNILNLLNPKSTTIQYYIVFIYYFISRSQIIPAEHCSNEQAEIPILLDGTLDRSRE